MIESAMIADLFAAQQEMPKLQKTAINPFFHNKYVPLEAVLEAVLPILNAHNFILLQMPTALPGDGLSPGLETRLLHVSGESISSIMPLCMKDEGPQAQGSGITYARRYALLATLGLSADVDDDAEATRTFAQTVRAAGQEMRAGNRPPTTAPRPQAAPRASNPPPRVGLPSCPVCNGPVWSNIEKKRTGEFSAKSPDYKCKDKQCDGAIWPGAVLAEGPVEDYDPDSLPFE